MFGRNIKTHKIHDEYASLKREHFILDIVFWYFVEDLKL